MESKAYQGVYKSSVSLLDLEGNMSFGYIEKISADYVVLRGIEDEFYKPLSISMYLYYYNNKGYIEKTSFRNIPIYPASILKKGTYKFTLSDLSKEQREFLEKYNDACFIDKQIHKSNRLDLDFELALNITNPKIQKLYEFYSMKDIFNSIKKKNQLEETIFNKLTLSRIYYGNEFCERLLPTIKEINGILKKLKKEDLELTFLTPTLYEEDTAKFLDIINMLDEYGEENGKQIEVVFNNWGTFQIMKNKKHIKPVVGRLLFKFKRDPRFSYENNELFKKYNKDLRSGDLSVEIYKDFLIQNKLDRVEVDCLPQGIPLDLSTEDCVGINLHFPFYVASSSRMCMLGTLGRDFNTIYDFKQPCKFECRKYYYDVAFWDKILMHGDSDSKKPEAVVRGKGFLGSIGNWKENFNFELAHNKNIKRLVYYYEYPY